MIDPKPDASPAPWRRYLPLAALLALALLTYAMGWHRHLSLESVAVHRGALQEFVAAHFVLALACYAAVYVAAVALSLPGGALLTIVGGFLFGWLVGGSVAVLAATAGATLLFLIARTSFGEIVSRRAGPLLQKLSAGFREDAMSYLLFLRLVPVFPFWLVNLAPALLGVPLRTFVIATFLGIIPATYAFAVLGSGLDSVILAQSQAYQGCLAQHGAGSGRCAFRLDPAALLTRQLIVAFIALGLVALIPVIVRKLKERS